MLEDQDGIVPAEIDGDVMYAGGRILLRGDEIGDWNGEPLYEWWPVQSLGDVDA